MIIINIFSNYIRGQSNNVLSDEEAEIDMKEGKWYCAKCKVEMKKTILDTYEYVEGIPIHDVEGYRCSKCDELFFTEKQADKMERMTKKQKEHMFMFVRKVSYSGRSLIITIPEDLATHLDIERGQKVKIMPMDKKGFLVEVKK